MIWCLHGALGSTRDWLSLINAPSLKPWRPRAVDLWSTSPPLEYRPWAAEWTAGIAAIDPAPVVLGYSMGGRLALHAALSAPIWRAAIIISAHTGLASPVDRAQRLAADQQWLDRFYKATWTDFLNQWNQQAVFGGKACATPPQHDPAMSRCFREWSLGQQRNLLPDLGSMRCPVLWIVGERDAKFRGVAEQATSVLPSATLVIAPNCGHRVPWDWPDFVPTVAHWCAANL